MSDSFPKMIHFPDAIHDGCLHFIDNSRNIQCCDCRFIGQAPDFPGNHGKTSSILTGFFRFDGGIQGQEIGLIGNFRYGCNNGVDAAGLLANQGKFIGNADRSVRQGVHGFLQPRQTRLSVTGQSGSFPGGFLDAIHRPCKLLRSC